MSLLLKDPLALLDYAVDWGDQYLENDYLAASRWEVSPVHEGGVRIDSEGFAPLVATVTVGGGHQGLVYSLTNHATFQSGREDRRSIQIRVEAR